MADYTKTDLQEKTVDQLRTMAKRRNIEVEARARKDDIISSILKDLKAEKARIVREARKEEAKPAPTPMPAPRPVFTPAPRPAPVAPPRPAPVVRTEPVTPPPAPEPKKEEVKEESSEPQKKKSLYHWVR